jgi:hypothetical protein
MSNLLVREDSFLVSYWDRRQAIAVTQIRTYRELRNLLDDCPTYYHLISATPRVMVEPSKESPDA